MTTTFVMSVIVALLKISFSWVNYARNKKLIDMVEAASMAKGLSNAIGAMQRAQKIRNGISVMPRSSIDDILRPPSRR